MKITNQKIIITEDGSHSLFVDTINENYHSVHGATQESTHIFIQSGLANLDLKEVNILELGFGTGLNAALTLAFAKEHSIRVNYTSIEKFPLSKQIYQQLNYAEKCGISDDLFLSLHKSDWNKWEAITPYFNLQKIEGEIETWLQPDNYDMVYFDAFSPDKQPELWSPQVFENMYLSCKPGALLTTYCAKGVVRRTMQAAGFTVERLPGPPGKREMLRAKK